MIDGLYPARNQSGSVIRFTSFKNDWFSSILVSQDMVAIDSVGLDFLRNEQILNPVVVDVTGNPDNYLHEAASANKPPSKTAYDPEGDGTTLQSLGVHEHWNNPKDKQYSRNLGIGNGIELVYVKMQYRVADINSDQSIDVIDLFQLAEMWLWTGFSGQIVEDIQPDGQIDLQDFAVLSQSWE